MDVTGNDLPWQFTIDNVPAMIFFPAERYAKTLIIFHAIPETLYFLRKSESVVFPSYAPWTLPNLVAFVLAHSQSETRLRFALSTCVRNSTSDGTAADSRCLVRNRYRTWRQLLRVERKIRYIKSDIYREMEFAKWNWDHDDDDAEWRVYLQRSWAQVWNLEMKSRALRTLLTDALLRSHFDALRGD